MISTFSFGQLITIYSIIVHTWEFFDCHEFCEDADLLSQAKIISQSDTHKYSHYYHYSQFIRSNQPSPIVSENFEKLDGEKQIKLKFPFKFYGAHFYSVYIDARDEIYVEVTDDYRGIANYINDSFVCENEILNGDYILKAIQLIHSNGKIHFYYENIPRGLKGNVVLSRINYYIWCGIEGYKGPQAVVPSEWITNGTLVEYEVLGDCPKHNSTAACHDAPTSNTMCIWCEKANACITSNDKDVHDLKVNGCQIKNMTTDTIEDTGERKSPQYVYIVVPLVISFLIVCIGCGIWLWFHRRKRVYP
ncbi:unnamed protein product [Schistosoma margrebowiei]|uniref:Egg protein CP391S-like protein n=1 Tax=Schistosoma margrebowiei TaxID=48269 RepID=A0AA85AGI1_9TREM|nr:unnamed protein product [Schistosoma margrebowiei]